MILKENAQAKKITDDFLESIKDLPAWVELYKLNHWSPTQLNTMICLWGYKYLYLSQEERRNLPGNAKMFTGTALGEMLILTFGNYIWKYIKGKGLVKEPIPKQRKVFDKVLEEFNLYKPVDDEDKKSYDICKAGLAKSYLTLKNAIKDVGLTGETECERSISLDLENCILPVSGRIDMENENAFIEFKTKHRKKNRPKKDGTSTYSLPNINQGYMGWQEHLLQVATYYFACKEKKKPHLVVMNEEKYNIFTPDNCDELKPENLKLYVNKMARVAHERESIMAKHAGKSTWVDEITPDFTHFFWKSMGEHLDIAKKLWKLN
mgnify:FL=1|tara:strand:- start:528 stop:1490 length:963 start_codon:yes stop_codon:yes gene_type:complete